jgi:hypothetical protein
MKELLEYRVFLVGRLGEAAKEFCDDCESTDPSAKVTGEWTVHQVAVHMRDINRLVYDARARRTMQEENPLFESFDPDEWMAAHYDKNESVKKILNEFKTDVDELCKVLSAVPVEVWSRLSRHETIGDELPLQLWVERGLAHIEEHITELKKLK